MVTLDQIKELRSVTGVAMQACKNALEEAGGDMEKAIIVLRKKGESKAAERINRSTGQGVIATVIEGNKASIVELRCETDFVARGEDFQKIAKNFAEKAIKGELKSDNQELKDLGLRVGEKVEVGNQAVIEGETLGSYVHSNNKIGVIVALEGGASEELAKDITMQIAAMNPRYIFPDEVTEEELKIEREIWSEELKKSGKPEAIWPNIMQGKEKKFREEHALIKQNFVKEPNKKVEDVLGKAKVTKFVRFAI